MIDLKPVKQTKLIGLDKFIIELVELYENNKLPSKILLSGLKGVGKSTLAYHLINYILSKNEEFPYDLKNLSINLSNHSFKTILNNSNPNFYSIDLNLDKKFIDINQIRKLISNLTKSSFNKKPRFVLIDNIEFLNNNSINALLKILEEPTDNVHFILINNNKKILETLLSRCINFRIYLSNKETFIISNKLLDGKINEIINEDLINYYSTPGNIFNLANFAFQNEYDLNNSTLKDFLKIIINNNHYKKDSVIKHLIYDYIEFYFYKINSSLSSKINKNYKYFLKRISEAKKFNLDEESIFIEFEDKILNG